MHPFADTRPTFTWSLNGHDVDSTLYVSTFPAGSGLFPADTDPKGAGSTDPILAFNGDSNRNRIVSIVIKHGDPLTYTLPDALQLTPGQTYFWDIEAITEDGRVQRKSASFKTAPIMPQGRPAPQEDAKFTGVTVITHGFEIPVAQSTVPDGLFQMARLIAKRGDGDVFIYDRDTGGWQHVSGLNSVVADDLGKPLVLLFDRGFSAPSRSRRRKAASAMKDRLSALSRIAVHSGGIDRSYQLYWAER